jgi:hypothetical protein
MVRNPQQGEHRTMPMTLYFKRAKAFVSDTSNDRGTLKFLAQPGPTPMLVPFWVAETATFKRGIEDGSIINLTPPHLMPGYKHPEVPAPAPGAEVPAPAPGAEVPAPAPGAEEPEPAPGEGEQMEPPVAPFGAQPMTPVQPGPKVGGITAGAKRTR